MSLYKIKAIRECIIHKAYILLIHSLVLSRIDYANSLYCNLPNYRLNKLNMIIRSSVRIINNLNIYFHASISKMSHNLEILDADDFPLSSLRSAKSAKLNLLK